ncbi:MAG: heparan-alpha-glucosaminide N-acetyltransferase domain-containing protein, partial [Acidobacteria bacterium]|nr:heparan-alpha-glucosaminide N-acetyltransferase domain-containing protein [Acidobacteriota bacterium]
MLTMQAAKREDATSLQPVQPSERIPALDVLRGFALFGVLLAYTLWNLGTPPEHTYSQADQILNFALAVLVDTKFYTLFAFLFGLGFSIQLTRAEARGASIVPVYCRRLLALLLIGLAHALLLRNGDIL